MGTQNYHNVTISETILGPRAGRKIHVLSSGLWKLPSFTINISRLPRILMKMTRDDYYLSMTNQKFSINDDVVAFLKENPSNYWIAQINPRKERIEGHCSRKSNLINIRKWEGKERKGHSKWANGNENGIEIETETGGMKMRH